MDALNHLVFHGLGLLPCLAALENLLRKYRPPVLLFMMHHVVLSVLDSMKIIINLLFTNKSYSCFALFGKGRMLLTVECWIRLLDALLKYLVFACLFVELQH